MTQKHPPSRRRRLTLVALLVAATVGCSRQAPDKTPRLVLLYAPCTVNKSFLGPYNDAVTYTPNLDRFAERALVFTRHHTESGQSGIAFASLFTGTQATTHGIFNHPSKLSDDLSLVTEAFKAGGYVPYAWLGQQMASAGLNYAQGVAQRRREGRALTADRRMFRGLLKRLKSKPDYRAFVVTNFTVTHGPYKTRWLEAFCEQHPADCAVRDDPRFARYLRTYHENMRALGWAFDETVERLKLDAEQIAGLAAAVELVYKSNVFHLDRIFGQVLDAIADAGLLDDTVIAFTSDHGEIFYRTNAYLHWTHGLQLAPEVLNVAWLLYGPGAGVKAGRYEATTRSIDVYPTLAGLAGVDAPSFDDRGIDLTASIRAQRPPPHLFAFSHTAVFTEPSWPKFSGYTTLARLVHEPLPESMWVGVRDGDTFAKLRRPNGDDWQRAVFDLASDPGETRNLYDPSNGDHQRLFEDLQAYKTRLVARARGAESTVPHDRAADLLRSLGYID